MTQRVRPTGYAAWLAIWCVAFVLAFIVSSIALSHHLEERYPAHALTFFPFNADAQVRLISTQLGMADARDLPGLESRSRPALRYASGDARLYSLLGEMRYRQDDKGAAYSLFDHARGLSKTEVHALKREILRLMESGRFAESVGGIEILLRRWPEMSTAIAPLISTIAADATGYGAMVATLAAQVPWRRRLLWQLARDPAGIDLADRLLLDLRGSEMPPQPGELSTVIGNYIAAGRYDAANRLFLFTLSASEQLVAGYIHNGGFQAPSLNRPFDWQLRAQPGVEVKFAEQGETVSGRTGATLRFLNRPFKGSPMQQYLLLPPGSYMLTMNASGDNLSLPKELFWTIECVPLKTGVAKLSIPEGTFEKRDLDVAFTVPSEGCVAQMLRLESAVIVESWRDSYGGELIMHELRIERLAA